MTRIACVCALAIGIASSAAAQATGAGYEAFTTSLAGVANTMHAAIRQNLAEAAETVPANEYAFKPTPDVRTFAQLVGHVVNANWFFCSQARQERSPDTTNYENVSDKATLVKALHDSLAYCDHVYAATTDASFTQPIRVETNAGMPPANTVRGAILTFNTAHNNEHYGNMVLYMRLKGHVPPSTSRTQR